MKILIYINKQAILNPLILSLLINLLFFLNVGAVTNWTPPADPNVREIMNEAKRDSAEGRQDIALQKYQWFANIGYYDHYESKRAALNDVFYEWCLFAEKHKPAWEALVVFRDNTIEKIKKDDLGFIHFYLVSSINRYIGDDISTISLFKWLDANNEELARVVYSRAEPTLVFYQKFALCNKYLDPQKRMESLKLIFKISINNSKENIKNKQEGQFMNLAAGSLFLLVVNDRIEEAKSFESEALDIVDNDIFRKMIADAYGLKFPKDYFKYAY